jgi:hypothetical protein
VIVELKHEYSPFREMLEEYGDIVEVEIKLGNGKRYTLAESRGRLKIEWLDGPDTAGMFMPDHADYAPPKFREPRPLEDE